MKIFRIEEFAGMETPNPGTRFRQDILTNEQKARCYGIVSTVRDGVGFLW